MSSRGDRFIPRLGRRILIEWGLSVLLSAVVVLGLRANFWVTAAVLVAVGAGLAVLLSLLELPNQSNLVRAGYWFLDPRPMASLHFLPPRELRDRQRTMSSIKALTSLRVLLRDLPRHGIQLLYIETALTLVGRVGFRRLWPAGPLSAMCTLLQEVVAERPRLRWPWVWVYVEEPAVSGRTAK